MPDRVTKYRGPIIEREVELGVVHSSACETLSNWHALAVREDTGELVLLLFVDGGWRLSAHDPKDAKYNGWWQVTR